MSSLADDHHNPSPCPEASRRPASFLSADRLLIDVRGTRRCRENVAVLLTDLIQPETRSATHDSALLHARRLIQLLRDRFLAAGGAIFERTSFRSAEHAKDGIAIRCPRSLTPQQAHGGSGMGLLQRFVLHALCKQRCGSI